MPDFTLLRKSTYYKRNFQSPHLKPINNKSTAIKHSNKRTLKKKFLQYRNI